MPLAPKSSPLPSASLLPGNRSGSIRIESNRNPNRIGIGIGIGLKLAQKPIYRCLCLFWLPLLIAVLPLLLQHEVATQGSWVLFILSADSLAKTDGLQKLNNCLRCWLLAIHSIPLARPPSPSTRFSFILIATKSAGNEMHHAPATSLIARATFVYVAGNMVGLLRRLLSHKCLSAGYLNGPGKQSGNSPTQCELVLLLATILCFLSLSLVETVFHFPFCFWAESFRLFRPISSLSSSS